MTTDNTLVFLSSVDKTCNRFKYYGEGSITNISLMKLIFKYACFSQTYATLQRLDSMLAYITVNDPDICPQKTALRGLAEEGINPEGANIGAGSVTPGGSTVLGVDFNAPVAAGGTVTVTPETYTFVLTDFTTGFTDADGDNPALFTLKTLPANGTLTYNGTLLTTSTSFLDPTLLVYTRNSDVAYGTTFTYSITDSNSQLPMESNTVTMTVTVEDIVPESGNEPAVIGDRAQYSGNRVTTVFEVADFTTRTIAPYFDPEANDLDAIRIDEVSTANTGVYYYLGSPVATGQIITNAELAVGAFYHTGPDSNSITTDSFNASVRDTGSMIWVQ